MKKRLLIALMTIVGLLFLSTSFLAFAGGSAGGIGMSVLQLYDHTSNDKKGPIVVLDVVLNAPAQKSGIEKGDIITKINGKSTSGMEFNDILTKGLRGPPGTEVTLTVTRERPEKTFTVILKRIDITY